MLRIKKRLVNDLPEGGLLQRTAFEIVLKRLHPCRIGNEITRELDRLDCPLGSERETNLEFSKRSLPRCCIGESGPQRAAVRHEVGLSLFSQNGRTLVFVQVVVEAFQPELPGKAVLEQTNDLAWSQRPPEDFIQIVNLVWHKESAGNSPLRVRPVKQMGQEAHIPLDKHAAFIQHGSAVCCHKRVPANRQPLDRQKILAWIKDCNPTGFQAVQHSTDVTVEDLKRRDVLRVVGEEK